MKTIKFDVMCDGRFVKTYKMDVHPIFPITDDEMRDFVVKRLPTYKNKDLKFYIYKDKDDNNDKD